MLVLLCGLAFSGKSTLAAAFARRGFSVVSLDAINAARGLDGGAGIPVEEWARTHREALGQVETELRAGRSVVVDDTNCFRFLRDDHRAVASALGVETVVVWIDRPLSLIRERMRANERMRARPGIAEEVLLDLAQKFEPPGPDERILVYPPDSEPDAWIEAQVWRGSC